MENIKLVAKNKIKKSTAPKEQTFHLQLQEYNIFMNTLASVVEKHGAEILKELNCVLYSRVSTEMQVEGFSLNGQINSLKRFADREEMLVTDIL